MSFSFDILSLAWVRLVDMMMVWTSYTILSAQHKGRSEFLFPSLHFILLSQLSQSHLLELRPAALQPVNSVGRWGVTTSSQMINRNIISFIDRHWRYRDQVLAYSLPTLAVGYNAFFYFFSWELRWTQIDFRTLDLSSLYFLTAILRAQVSNGCLRFN